MLVPHSAPTTVSLTPPLTPASTLSTDTDASIPSLHIPAPAIPSPPSDSCCTLHQVHNWSSSPDPVEQLQPIDHSSFVNATNSTLCIMRSPVGQGGALDGPTLQSILASFGELRVFSTVSTRTYHAEFFDVCDVTIVLDALNGRVICRQRLHIVPYSASAPDLSFIAGNPNPSPPKHEDSDAQNKNTVSFPSTSPLLSSRRFSIDSSLPPAMSHPSPLLHHSPMRTRDMSNIYLFDSTGKHVVLCTPCRPRSISSVASDDVGLAIVDMSSSGFVPLPVSSSSSSSPGPDSQHSTPFVVASSLLLAHKSTGPIMRYHADILPERNRIDVARIERGKDPRTTVMIKNIPNQMGDKNLIDFINDACPRKIDFLYLRIDFANGCNVGYAFVNFIHVQDLLHFSKLKLGTQWNVFSSKKILGMSYAAYQGKEALVDKFRSSPVMDQRESWRPKLFYSAGPMQGLPQDFPASTHVQRKERGADAGLHQGHRHDGRDPALFNRSA